MWAVCNQRCNGALWLMLGITAMTGCAATGNNTPVAASAPVQPAAQAAASASASAEVVAQRVAAPASKPADTKSPEAKSPEKKSKDKQAAAVTLDASVTAVPPAAQRQFDNALGLLKSGQPAAAQPVLLQMTRDYPALAAPWVNLGLLELKAGHNDAALTYFQEAVAHDAKSAVAQSYLGLGYRQSGKFKQAEAAYQAALALDSRYALAHYNLGVLYDLYLQRPDQAVQHYESYQALLDAPDAKVAAWIKDLKARLASKTKAGAAS